MPAALKGDGDVAGCALLGGSRGGAGGGARASGAARTIKTRERPRSQFVGVSSRQDGRYKSVVAYRGQSLFIGDFASETDAALHYNSVAAPLGKRLNNGLALSIEALPSLSIYISA